jgi:hypothetical protein
MVLVLPSVWTGWQQDDLVHRYFLLGNPDYKGETVNPWELFRFLDGTPDRGRALIDGGFVTWWTLENLRLSFWRPLASLTMWVDYLLWPNSGPLMHMQNLLWFGAVIFVAALLYRQYITAPWVAGLAALFYAIDDAHGLPAGWLAGRNALLVALFGLLVLLFHDRWRRKDWRVGAFVAPLCLVLGLLSGEGVLAVGAYLFAYALFLDPGTPRQKVMSLLPYAVIALVWLIYYRLQGYGAWGSGFYVDIMSEPVRFGYALLERGPVLLLDQWGFPPSALYMMLPPEGVTIVWLWALVFLLGLGVALYPLLRRDATARFWALGMLLSVPLICSTMPHGRLLFFVGIGGMGLLAQWMTGVQGHADWVPANRAWRIPARILFIFFIVIHLVFAPLSLPINSTGADWGQKYIQDAAEIESLDAGVVRQDLIFVNPPIVFYAQYIYTARYLANLPLPRRVRALAPGMVNLQITRPDDRTLIIRPEGGYLAYPFDNVYRGPAHPMHLGQRVELTNMTVEITDLTADNRPAEALFRFGVPLEDASLKLLKWEDGKYVPFVIPAVGDTSNLPAIPLEL